MFLLNTEENINVDTAEQCLVAFGCRNTGGYKNTTGGDSYQAGAIKLVTG